RRRHTSFSLDWSSDVCSSDLIRFPRRRVHGVAKRDRFRPFLQTAGCGGHIDIEMTFLFPIAGKVQRIVVGRQRRRFLTGSAVYRSEERLVGIEHWAEWDLIT